MSNIKENKITVKKNNKKVKGYSKMTATHKQITQQKAIALGRGEATDVMTTYETKVHIAERYSKRMITEPETNRILYNLSLRAKNLMDILIHEASVKSYFIKNGYKVGTRGEFSVTNLLHLAYESYLDYFTNYMGKDSGINPISKTHYSTILKELVEAGILFKDGKMSKPMYYYDTNIFCVNSQTAIILKHCEEHNEPLPELLLDEDTIIQKHINVLQEAFNKDDEYYD